MLPVVVEMRYEPGNEHEVERPLAGHLIRDVDLTAPRVAERRFHAGDSCVLSPDSQQPGDGASAESPGPGFRNVSLSWSLWCLRRRAGQASCCCHSDLCSAYSTSPSSSPSISSGHGWWNVGTNFWPAFSITRRDPTFTTI